MRRLTWMLYNHRVAESLYTVKTKGMIFEPAPGWHFIRQPMQRTEYYMPWGVVTVDELSKMEYVERADWWNEPDYEYTDSE